MLAPVLAVCDVEFVHQNGVTDMLAGDREPLEVISAAQTFKESAGDAW